MHRKGFALFEVIIVLGIVAFLIGGGFYLNSAQNQKSTVQIGNDALEKAKELQQQSQLQANQEGDAFQQLNDSASSSATPRSPNVPTTAQPPAVQKPIMDNDAEPSLLLKSIGFYLDYYDAKTGMAGDMQFTQLPLKNNFGWIMADFGTQDPRTSDPTKTNPQPVFILPLGTKVHSLVDGIVVKVQQLYSGDYSIMVANNENSNWIYETEHVKNPLVKKGDQVIGGQVIAEVSDHDADHNPGFGIVEIGILHGGNPPHHVCPFAYLDESIKDDIQKKITALHNDWETYRGDASLYKDLSTYALPGCATLMPANG